MNKYKQCIKSVRDRVEVLVKQSNPNFTNWQKRQWALEVIGKQLDDSKNDMGILHASAMALCVNAYIMDLNNTIIHHYISDDSLESFLRTTLVKDISILEDSLGTVNSILVHTHNNGYCISKIITKDGKFLISVMANDRITTCGLEKLSTLKKENIERYEDVCFAINLLYYMKAFPNKVVEGSSNRYGKE